MKVIEIHNKFFSIPTQWNELTAMQLRKIVQILLGSDLLIPGQVKLFKILTGCSWWNLWRIGPWEYDDKLYLTEFLLKENSLTKNLIPQYRGLFGPADEFNNMIVSEFIFAEQFYALHKNNEPTALDSLIATLYRPAKRFYNRKLNKDGDIRKEFNDNVLPFYTGKVSKWPMDVKLSILHWYEGCRLKVISDNPSVFGASSGESALYGLFSVMRGVAEKGVHGDLSKVEKMYVKVFLLELNELVAEAARIEKSQKP